MLRRKECFIISWLDHRSLLLANSINAHFKSSAYGQSSPVIIFTGVSDTKKILSDSKGLELPPNCRISHKDVCAFAASFGKSFSRLRIVLIDPDEEVNLKQAIHLAEAMRSRSNAEIYSVVSSPESECLLDALCKSEPGKVGAPMKIRRVLPVRSEVYRYIHRNAIFEDHIRILDEEWLSLVIVGLGEYGLEMLKAILWCGQMEGYYLRVDVFDADPDVQDRFYTDCPGIKQRGSNPRFGEDYYEIHFHPNTRIDTNQLFTALDGMPIPSWVLADAGDEPVNISLSMRLRAYFSRRQIHDGKYVEHSSSAAQQPRIQAVIHSDERAALIDNNALNNHREQFYQIECIGRDSGVYSYEGLFAEAFEQMALDAHTRWGEAELFNKYEYYRRSSLATVIFENYRNKYLPDNEMKAIVEHRRWNAYMRGTEGYQYGVRRDDLAKCHPSLTAYDNLAQVDQWKDMVISKVSLPSEPLDT